MRIVSGRWRGRLIKAPAGADVRPTADRVREAWMSIVQYDLPGARVLDLFAGSGALGFEALSRGAEHVDFIETRHESLEAVRANAVLLRAEESVTVHRRDALEFVAALDAGAYDVAFADPPYRQGVAARVATRWLTVPFAAVLGVEHGAEEAMPGDADVRRYGDTAIAFYRTSP